MSYSRRTRKRNGWREKGMDGEAKKEADTTCHRVKVRSGWRKIIKNFKTVMEELKDENIELV